MFPHKFTPIHGCLLIGLLGGCAQSPHFMDSPEPGKTAEIEGSRDCLLLDRPEDKLKLQIIHQLMDSGKLHAALAHLDATGIQSPAESYLRAEILRRTGRSDLAVPLYNRLTNGCVAGNAYHGLGLIAGRKGQIVEALAYLEKARTELPTDVRVRNDLGYALFLDQRYDSARHEFLTALELDENNEFSVSNLVLLLLVTGEVEKAKAMAVRMNLSGGSFTQLQEEARKIKETQKQPRTSRRSSPFKLGEHDPAENAGLFSNAKVSPYPLKSLRPSALSIEAKGSKDAPAENQRTRHLVKTTGSLEQPSASGHSHQP
jgi:Flp pilus assembly protein TadD